METRKYNNEFREKLVSKLGNIKTKPEMRDVYNIISKYEFSSNTNGLFFNINDFSDDVIQSLDKFTHEKGKQEGVKLEYTTYNHEDEHGELKNKDKVIIRKMKS